MSSESRKGRKKAIEQKAEAALKDVEREAEKAGRAVKKEVSKAEKAVKGKKSPKVAFPRPAGKIPEAQVLSRHGTEMISRRGRGFSPGELSGAGIAAGLAARWGVKIDSKRRSVLDWNVTSLKGWGSHAAAAAAARREASAAVEKAEEAAEAVEKGAAKAERAVKKEVKKAEAAVKEKAEKPKARTKKKSA